MTRTPDGFEGTAPIDDATRDALFAAADEALNSAERLLNTQQTCDAIRERLMSFLEPLKSRGIIEPVVNIDPNDLTVTITWKART